MKLHKGDRHLHVILLENISHLRSADGCDVVFMNNGTHIEICGHNNWNRLVEYVEQRNKNHSAKIGYKIDSKSS